MNTIFINSKKSKISDPHRPLLNLLEKMKLERSDKYVALSNLRYTAQEKYIKVTRKQ